jgi:hypothetical protein
MRKRRQWSVTARSLFKQLGTGAQLSLHPEQDQQNSNEYVQGSSGGARLPVLITHRNHPIKG